MRTRTILLSASSVVIVLIGLSVLVFHQIRLSAHPFTNQVASIFNISADVRQLGLDISNWNTMSKENQDLKNQLAAQMIDQEKMIRLENENEALRAAAGLSTKVHRSVIAGGIFQILLAPDGYTASINKGSQDGVGIGDTVSSPTGALIGTVQRVSNFVSTVILVSDPSFQVTARVLGGTVTGIARGALTDGIKLDLIIQSDAIQEGETLVSTGDDTTPAGLIIGTVRLVHANEAQLFKSVLVTPAAELSHGNVLIIKQ